MDLLRIFLESFDMIYERKYIMGKFVFKIAELDFETQYLNDAEMFMYKHFDNTCDTKGKNGATFKGTLEASW